MFKRILVPTDGSELSTEALRDAIKLAAECGASVVVLCTGVRTRQLTLVASGAGPHAGSVKGRYDVVQLASVES
jgi:nucleotide-binding universal stress UspA family protein